jgi:hypothetical protein
MIEDKEKTWQNIAPEERVKMIKGAILRLPAHDRASILAWNARLLEKEGVSVLLDVDAWDGQDRNDASKKWLWLVEKFDQDQLGDKAIVGRSVSSDDISNLAERSILCGHNSGGVYVLFEIKKGSPMLRRAGLWKDIRRALEVYQIVGQLRPQGDLHFSHQVISEEIAHDEDA